MTRPPGPHLAATTPGLPPEAAANTLALRRYYALHARIYDATRWSFLFGRSRLVDSLPRHPAPANILEVGCGTGFNLERLARQFPAARIAGWDGSPDMLQRARRRLAPWGNRCTLHHGFFGPHSRPDPAPDLVLFSYCLSMINPGWETVIEAATDRLAPGGTLAAVDFHGSRSAGFRRWMAANHVRMDQHLRPCLRARCLPNLDIVLPAWGGLWQYLLFIGRPAGHPSAQA